MRTAVVYNFLLEANLMASIAILLMLPIRRFLRDGWAAGPFILRGCWWPFVCSAP